MKNKIASFLIAFVIVAGGARNAYADSAAERLAAEGDKYFHAQDYPRAVAAYKMALSADPSLGRAYYGLALTYHQQEEWELAIAAWKHSQPLFEPDATGLVLLGTDYYHLKRYDETLAACRNAINLRPNADTQAQAYYWIGLTYNELKQPEKAAGALVASQRLDPADADVDVELGNAYYALKQYPEAAQALKQAVRLQSNLGQAYYNLFMTDLAMNKKDEAVQVYQRLLTIDKAKAQELEGLVTKIKQDQSSAKAVPKTNAETDQPNQRPDIANTADARRLMFYGVTLERAGRSDEAADQYRRAIALHPEADTLKEAHRYLDSLAVPPTVHLQLNVIYICNGEKLVLENCNIRDTSDSSNCLVQHPDRPTHNGLVAYTNETRGMLNKLVPTCQQPSARGVVPTPSATAKTK